MAMMLEFPLLPAVIIIVVIALSGWLGGLVVGGRIGYNERLRDELEDTLEAMDRRTHEYRASRNMSPLTPTFSYGRVPRDPRFKVPVVHQPRRWSPDKLERWAQRHWSGARPWRKRPTS
jgi:hypothetical protein